MLISSESIVPVNCLLLSFVSKNVKSSSSFVWLTLSIAYNASSSRIGTIPLISATVLNIDVIELTFSSVAYCASS